MTHIFHRNPRNTLPVAVAGEGMVLILNLRSAIRDPEKKKRNEHMGYQWQWSLFLQVPNAGQTYLDWLLLSKESGGVSRAMSSICACACALG